MAKETNAKEKVSLGTMKFILFFVVNILQSDVQTIYLFLKETDLWTNVYTIQ